jgi:thiol-disulfide isomerase/thioredoxin
VASKSFKQRQARRTAQAAAELRARRRRTITTISVVVVGLLFVAGLLAFALRSTSTSSANATTTPTGFDLPSLAGPGRIRLADFRGKPTVVNFFASWCTQCEAELPGFRTAVDKYKGKVNFVFINSNDPGNGKAMAKAHDLLSLPVARDVGAPDGSGLYRSLGGTGGMPITAFYDANGKVIDKSFGALIGPSLDTAIKRVYGVT